MAKKGETLKRFSSTRKEQTVFGLFGRWQVQLCCLHLLTILEIKNYFVFECLEIGEERNEERVAEEEEEEERRDWAFIFVGAMRETGFLLDLVWFINREHRISFSWNVLINLFFYFVLNKKIAIYLDQQNDFFWRAEAQTTTHYITW